MGGDPLRRLDGVYRYGASLVIKTWQNSPWRRRILLATTIISVVSLVASNFVYPSGAQAAVANGGTFTYGDSADNGNMNFRAFTDATTVGGELTTVATDTTNDISWIRTAAAPTREEIIAVHLKNTGRLDVVTCTSACDAAADWTLRGTYSTASTDANAENMRPFDVAYEQLSGNAVVFFTDDNTTGTIYYCEWNGSSWSPSTECNGGTFAPGAGNDIATSAVGVSGQVEWVRVEAKGDRLTTTRSDEILLAASDSADDMWLAKWDGSAMTQASNPVDNLAATNAQKFDIAWEETTGEGLAVFTDTVDAALRFSTYDSGSGWSAADTTNGPTNPTTTAWNSWLNLATDPTSDDIALIGALSTPDADAAVWTGAGWTDSNQNLTDQETPTGKNVAVEFERFSGRAIYYNVGLNDLNVDAHCWTSGGGFTTKNAAIGTWTTTDDVEDLNVIGSPNSNKMLGGAHDIVDDLEGFVYSAATGCADGDWVNTSVATLNAATEGVAGNTIRQSHMPVFKPYSPWSRNWEWFGDATENDPDETADSQWGGGAVSENTEPTTDVDPEDFVRLRVNVNETGNMAQSDTRKKLQYTSGCTPNSAGGEAGCTWTDVGDTGETTAVWRYATSGETCASCSDNTAVSTARLTGTTQNGTYTSDKDAAGGTNMDHTALAIREIDFPLKAEDVTAATTYYFRLYEPRIGGTTGQDSAVFREQDDDGANDCASATCTYPSLTTATATITISGTCDGYDQTTDCGDVGTVKFAVNGSVQAQEDTTIGGTWDITGVAPPSNGAVITVWIDAAASMADRAGAVTVYDGTGDVTAVQLFKEHLTIGSVDDQTTTNANVGSYDNSVASGDDDVFWEVSAGNDLVVDTEGQSSQEELFIASGDTFRPASAGGADVSTMFIEIVGTWTADNNAITVAGTSGTLFTRSGTFTQNTSTVNVTSGSGTPTFLSGATSFHVLTINAAATVVNMGSAVTINAVDNAQLNITAGVFNIDANNITGPGTGTGRAFSISAGAKLCLGGTTNSTSATCNNSATQTTSRDMPTFNTYTFNATSTVSYLTNVAQTVDSTPDYGHLILNPIITAGRLYTFEGAVDILGNFDINPDAASALALTVDMAGDIIVAATTTTTITRTGSNATSVLDTMPSATPYNLSTGLLNIATGGTLDATGATSSITITGTSGTLLTVAGTLTEGSSTVVFNGNGTPTALNGNTAEASTFNNLSLTPALSASGKTYTFGTTALIINGDFLIHPTGDQLLTVNPGASITVSSTKTTTITGTTATSKLDLRPSLTDYNLTTGILSIATGGTLDAAAAASVITLTGTAGTLFANTGTFTQGISEVLVTSASGSPRFLSGATTFHKLTINAAATIINMGSAVTVNAVDNAKLNITAGVFNVDANNITGPGAGTGRELTIGATGTLCLGGTTNSTTATCNSGATQTTTRDMPSFNTYTFNTASTVSYLSNVAQTVDTTPTYGNLNLKPLITAGRIYTFEGAATIDGNFDINPDAGSALALTVNMAGDITVASTKTLTITRTGSNATSVLDTRPSLTSYNITTYDLTIQAGGTLDAASASSAINISNSYTNNGTFTAGVSVTTFTATDSGNTLNGTMTGGSAFRDLIFNGASGAWAFSAAVAATQDFTVTNGAVTATNNNLTVTRDITLANTAGVSYVAGSSTVTVSRHFTDSGVKFSSGTSTLIMDGTGTFTGTGASTLYSFSLAYSGFTTTISVSGSLVLVTNITTVNGGTVTGTNAGINVRCNTTCSGRFVFASPTSFTGGGDNRVNYSSGATDLTITITGGNYGGWAVQNIPPFNNTTYEWGGGITTTSYYHLSASTGISGSVLNTANQTLSASRFEQGVSARTSTTTANFGSSAISLTSTSDGLIVGSNGGSHNLNLNTSTVDVKGNVLFVNGTGTMTVNPGSSTVTWTHTSGTRSYAPNGQSLFNITLNGSGGTVQPAAAVVASGNFTITAGTYDTVSGSNHPLTIGGSYSNSGTFTAQTGTVTFNATDTGNTLAGTMTSSSSFYDLTFSGSGGEWTPSAAVNISNDLTMTAGSLLGTQNITVAGHVQGTAGVINLTGGTFKQRASSSKNFSTTSGSTAWIFTNLTFSNSTGGIGTTTFTTQTGGSGALTVSGVLAIGESGDTGATVLDADNRTWTLSGTGGDPFQILSSPAGDLTPSGSTFAYTGNNGSGDTTVQSETYNVLQVNNGSETYNLEGATVGLDVTITAGTLALNSQTLQATNDLTVNGTLSGSTNVTVNGSVVGSGTITLSSGTFLQRATTNANETFGSTSGSNNWSFRALTFRNSDSNNHSITFNSTGSGQIIVGQNLTIGSASDSNTLTLDNDTNDRILDVNGSVSIASTAIFEPSSSASFTVGDDWTNDGTFNHNNGTVTFDTTTTATIAGATTFFGFASTTAAKTLQFTAGQTFTIDTGGLLTLTGAADPNEIQIQSTTGSQWFINHQGTESVSFAQVINSGCDGASTDISTSDSVDDGNNGTCWLFGSDFSQEDFRFGQPNGLDIDYTGAPAENAAYTTSGTSDDFRLRMLVHVSGSNLAQNGNTFKLQFGEKTAATCTSGVSWGDVATGSGVIRYFDGSPADGADLTANAGDPDHTGHTEVAQDYEEANNFTNSVATINSGQDGLWDFSLVNNSAVGGKRYCFKIVDVTGAGDLTTYNQYPEVIVDEELIATLDATSKNFGVIQPGGNPTDVSSTLTTTTNSSTGYVVYTWSTQLMTMGAFTLPDWTGNNVTPSTFGNGSFGFGYTTDDNNLTGGGASRFSAGTLYAGFVHTGPGDPVADRGSGPTAGQVDTVGYRIAASGSQAAGPYSTIIVYVWSVTF